MEAGSVLVEAGGWYPGALIQAQVTVDVDTGSPEFHSFARKLLICRFAEGRFCHNSRLSRAAEAR
jgi:hypothetical protein